MRRVKLLQKTYSGLRKGLLIFSILGAFLFIAVGPGSLSLERAPWVIAMYGGWDNTQFGLFPSDLWGQSRKMLARIARLAPPSVPFVLLYDGLAPGDSELIDLRKNESLVDNGEVIDATTHEVNYGDPKTLSRFIIWMNKTYPAKHFLLGFGHHYGWQGFNTDESSPGPRGMDIITMPEYRGAMTVARDAGVRVDIQWFEACSCTMIETLYEYAAFSTYVVGNEDTIDFFDMAVRFPRALRAIGASPEMPPEDVAKILVNTYPLHTPSIVINQIMPFQYTINPRSPSLKGGLGFRKWSPTQFAVDCRRIPELARAVADLAAYIMGNVSAHRGAALKAARTAQKYTLMPWYVDLYDWADRLENLSPDPAIKERCRKIKTFVNSAVFASAKLDSDTRRHGILIIFPQNGAKWRVEKKNEFDTSNTYSDLNFAKDTHWDELMDALFE